MMNQTDGFNYLKNDKITGIKLPYGTNEISFYSFIPTNKNTDIDTLISDINLNTINKIMGQILKVRI